MNEIVKTTMAMITVVAVMAAVFVPMTMEFGEQAHYSTNRNEGGYYTLAETTDKVVVEIDNTSPRVKINGRTYEVSEKGSYLVSDFAMLGSLADSDDIYHTVFTTELTTKIFIGETANSLKITFNDGTATMDVTTGGTTTTYTGDYSYILHYSGGAGNYIESHTVTGNNKKVNADSKIYFIRNGGSNSASLIAGPFEASALSGSGTLYSLGTGGIPTSSTVNVNWTLTDNEDGTYTVQNPAYGDESTNIGIYLVPVKYQVYNEDSMMAFMVNILPVLVGLAFLAGIGMYITRFKN